MNNSGWLIRSFGEVAEDGPPFPQKSVSSDEMVLSVTVFSPEGGRS